MKFKSTFAIALVAYLCVFLTGGPFVLTAFAKITMKPTDDDMKIVTIVKGDTLWDLAAKYLEEPTKWPWFKKYNEYTNPDLIYPGEEMQVPLKWLKGILEEEQQRGVETSAELEEIRAMYQETMKQLDVAKEELDGTRELLNSLRTQNASLEKALQDRDDQMTALRELFEESRGQLGGELEAIRDMLDDVAKSGDLRRQLKATNESLMAKIELLEASLEARSKQLEDTQARGVSLETQVAQLHTQLIRTQEMITALETRISEVEGVVENPSKNKKLFAFLTAVAGGIAWVAVNSLSHAE